MAIAFINSTALQISAGTASTWSIPTHSSRQGGAAFIVGVGLGSTTVTVDAVTDNAGNVYAEAAEVGSSKTVGAALWYATNCSSASTRISITLSGNSSGSIAVGQWSGISTANALVATDASASTALSTLHQAANDVTATNATMALWYARSNVSTMSPVTTLNGSLWTSTGDAVRQVGGQFSGITGTSTWSGHWLSGSGAAGSSGRCQHALITAVFSDTTTPPAGYWTPTVFGLMGVQ